MGTQETIICRLCLKICDKFKVIEGNIKDILDVLVSKIDLDVTQQPVMCINCAKQLMICFDFKAMCIYTHDYLLPFVNTATAKLNLRDLYLIKNESSVGVPGDQDICGFCMSPVKSCSAISLDVGEGRDVMMTNMIELCFPDLDLSVINTPVICARCHESLENCFHFVTNCLTVEERIKKYCESLDIDSKSQIELSSLLEFKIRNATTNEVDEFKFVDKIKLENKEGSHELVGIKTEEMFWGENKIKMETLVEVEDQKIPLKEETQIKMDESDCNRFDEGVNLSQLEVTKLDRKQKLTIVKCEYCSYQTSWKSNLKIHVLTHKNPSRVRIYKCDDCSFETKFNHSLKTHLLMHKDPSVAIYKCDSCCYQTMVKYNLKKHLLKHKDPSDVTMYKCALCSYQTIQKSNLTMHLLTHKDPSEVKMYKCDSCAYRGKRKGDITNHKKAKHKDPSEVKMYKCDSCAYQTVRKSNLNKHKKCKLKPKAPSEVAIYKCYSCSFQTRNKYSFRKHLLLHKPGRTVYKCDSCPFQTPRKDRLTSHLLKHQNPSEVAMYKCDSCSYQTLNKQCFNRHFQKHKDVTVYKCTCCSYQTTQKSNFDMHLLKHKDPSEVKIYKCDSCAYRTILKSNLEKHKKNKLKQK